MAILREFYVKHPKNIFDRQSGGFEGFSVGRNKIVSRFYVMIITWATPKLRYIPCPSILGTHRENWAQPKSDPRKQNRQIEDINKFFRTIEFMVLLRMNKLYYLRKRKRKSGPIRQDFEITVKQLRLFF